MTPPSVIGKSPTFAAIDFETADYHRDSACALAIAHVQDGQIVRETSFLIRPPRRRFVFTYLHGITWKDVADQPTFGDLWPSIRRELSGLDFLAAHNASFDRGVLFACCEGAGCSPPPLEFLCTVRVARHVWGFSPATLSHVCSQLRIGLRHHDPVSDAKACARILLKALKSGQDLPHFLGSPPVGRYSFESTEREITTGLKNRGARLRKQRLRDEQAEPTVHQRSPLATKGMENGEVLLNSREVAILLDMSPDDVVDLARKNQIPGMKIGKRWKFRKCDIEEKRKQPKQ
ncbi:MAG: helix-turn-helix domain-containing protein [bacterium]|nr:helix-turn-helix domain-containing protein [bacterium]